MEFYIRKSWLKKCDLCSVPGNIQEYLQSHGVVNQEKLAKGEILETFAPALPI
jgi:hypothetical protein